MNKRKDMSLMTVVLGRLNLSLPRLLDLDNHVGNGGRLLDEDLYFLHKAIEDSKRVMPLFKRNPEFQMPEMKLYSLYNSILKKALDNE